jgi:hypothetical protein
MSRNVLVAFLGMVVFLVVAGAVYLEIAAAARATDVVWEVSRSVSAGDVLTSDNVHQTRVPRASDTLDYFTGNLLGAQARASHDMAAGTIVFQNDVLDQDVALVNLTLRTPPQLGHGQTIDVYAQVGGQTMMVGRRLMVDQVTGSNCSVWVPASDEPYWITLQAGNVALYAARSTGIGVPQYHAQSMQEAIAALTGGSVSGLPTPTPSPTRKP